MALVQLAYLSSTPVLLSADAIAQILLVSRENNSRAGVTGLLVYKDGNVLQFLEGEDQEVEKLFAKISEDTRHRGIIRLFKKTIERRDFPEWTMGFYDLPAEGATYLDGYSGVMEKDFDLQTINSVAAQKLLHVFKAKAEEKSA